MQVAIEEVRRLQRFGVTAGELERYKMALLRDSAQAAEQALSVPSADQLDFIMESLALGHRVLDQRQVRLRLPYRQLVIILSAGAWSQTSFIVPAWEQLDLFMRPSAHTSTFLASIRG